MIEEDKHRSPVVRRERLGVGFGERRIDACRQGNRNDRLLTLAVRSFAAARLPVYLEEVHRGLRAGRVLVSAAGVAVDPEAP